MVYMLCVNIQYHTHTHAQNQNKILLISHHKNVMDMLHRRDPNPGSRPSLKLVQLPLGWAWLGVCGSTHRICRQGLVSRWRGENVLFFFPRIISQCPLPGSFDLFLFFCCCFFSLATPAFPHPDTHTHTDSPQTSTQTSTHTHRINLLLIKQF